MVRTRSIDHAISRADEPPGLEGDERPKHAANEGGSLTRQGRFSNILTEKMRWPISKMRSRHRSPPQLHSGAAEYRSAGDREAKLAFALLLTPPVQRAVFLRFIGKRECWPRIRSLVGIPPYTFLHEGDNFVLNATGICPSRTNMTAIRISANRDFAKQFTDDHGRQYRLISDDSKSKAVAVRRARLASRLVVDAMLAPIARRPT